MKNELSDKPISEITTDDMAEVVTNMLGQTISVNNKKLKSSISDILNLMAEEKNDS